MRIRERLGWFGLATLLAAAPAVRAQERPRPVRVGNTNLLLLGGGYDKHDHPNYKSRPIVDISVAKRVFRREVPYLPLWVRAGVNFSALDHKAYDEFGIWPTPLPGQPSKDYQGLKQHTSDFTIRGEFMGDLLHTQHAALYGGGGLALHYLSFSSGGYPYTYNFPFSTTESKIAPSLVAGGRVFLVKIPVTGYAEVRYGRAFGKIDVPKSQYLLDDDFEFTSVSAVALVGGLGLHW